VKRNHLYLLSIGLFVVAAVCFILVNANKNEKVKTASFYPLKERKGAMAQSAEASEVKKQFAGLLKIVRTNPNDIKSRIALAALYIQEARITSDYAYYDKAAMKYVDEVLEKDATHFEALTFRALIYLSQHHFAEGLAVAEKVRAANPYNAFVHGMLVDANVELGNYAKAVEEAEKMISIRPDLRSYSRVSYLREIHGDYPGAIGAMKLAVDAGLPGDEATEWSRVHLGHLYEMIGDAKTAETQYLLALDYRPGYAYALAGRGRIALALQQYEKAIGYYEQADSLINDHSFKEGLAEAYKLSGQKNKAESILQQLIHMMDDHAADTKGHHHEMEHHADLELAHIYLKTGDYNNALEHAMEEYERRPGNIEVNETIALVYYMKKEFTKALPYMEMAMKTKSKDPNLLCLAGLVYAKTGNKEKAKPLLKEISDTNAAIEEPLKAERINVLSTL
jgi:tetratricopeptide (TPR) repeat protein